MPKTYVDNASNRSLGRVGMTHGTAVVSRGSSGSSSSGWSNFGASHSTPNYGVNLGTPTKTYVDNAANRSLGRVGMTHGTAVVSRGSSNVNSNGTSRSSPSASYTSGSAPNTYVDNASNRSLGRVGMEHGTAVVSRGSSGSSGSSSNRTSRSTQSASYTPAPTSNTYVDNASNRRLGRAGMERGTAVVSKEGSSRTQDYCNSPRGSDQYTVSKQSSSSASKTYVDNEANRRLGRVGLEHGMAVISKQTSSSGSQKDHVVTMKQSRGITNNTYSLPIPKTEYNITQRVYVDNKLNRSLGRVGKPIGTAVFSKSSQRSDGTKEQRYVDNRKNRAMGRVDMPRGSSPKKTSKFTKDIEELLQQLDDPYDDESEDYNPYVVETVVDYSNRQLQEEEWRNETRDTQSHTPRDTPRDISRDSYVPKTEPAILTEYCGKTINFNEIELKRKIGHGGFGDVYFAMWKGSVVAVKKLRVERVSKRRLKEFAEESVFFGNLNHGNIVKFIGACLESPNLAIVMEYMQMSLFEGIFVNKDVEFSEIQSLDMLVQTSAGLSYMKQSAIAHCDLKSQNVLINTTKDGNWIAKITDFGLSMIKVKSETTGSGVDDRAQHIGTPRYSAPEVLRGERLSVGKMMKADVYSLGMVMFEVIYEDEPFYDLNLAQLTKQVGENGLKPEMSYDIKVNKAVSDIMTGCLSFEADKRPDVTDVFELLKNQASIFDQVDLDESL